MSKGLAWQGLPFTGLETLLGENFQSGECPLDRWSKERYPWLDDADERKHMTDKEILDKYINLKDSCLEEKERKQVM